MLVANSFDLWQKDTFFSAAEEVQQSADIMESAYRTWLRARREEGLTPQHLDELNRELRTALGTAKWQLEEFEKAVCQSYRNSSDDITVTRHRQFVSAIEQQISRVETALKDSLDIEGKKPFRWVNLDEDECNDLAYFLSGTSQSIKDEGIELGEALTSSPSKCNIEEDHSVGSSSKMQIPDQDRKIPETRNEISYQGDQITSNRREWSSPDRNALEIVIDSNDRHTNALIEATPKEKGSKPFFWRSRCGNDPSAKGLMSRTQTNMMNWINHHFRGGSRSQRQLVSPVLPAKSIRFMLALMLTVFLVVPFLLYSN